MVGYIDVVLHPSKNVKAEIRDGVNLRWEEWNGILRHSHFSQRASVSRALIVSPQCTFLIFFRRCLQNMSEDDS